MELSTQTNIFTDGNNTQVSTTSNTASSFNCTTSLTEVKCEGAFNFAGNYQPSSNTTLDLTSGEDIRLVNGSTQYFTLSSIGPINVNSNTTYSSIQITWVITIP